MAAVIISIGPYLTFLTVLVSAVIYVYWEKHASAAEMEEEEEEEGIDNEYYNDHDIPWIPYHETKEPEDEIGARYAPIPSSENEGDETGVNKQRSTIIHHNLVQPVENYASSGGSIFARA